MTKARETIETDEPRLVEPEPENTAETPILQAIEASFCKLDDLTQFTLPSTFCGWQAGNDISKVDLDDDLVGIIDAAQSMRENIGQLAERQVRDECELQIETCANAIRQAADTMTGSIIGIDDLGKQIETIETAIASLREDFGLFSF